MAKSTPERKVIDRKQVTDYLYRAFEKAAEGYGSRNKAVKGTALYGLQVDMAYLIDEIERGPEASAKHAITQANRLINSLTEETEGA